jgi:2-(1,2-epoxy-1,2-dihydrophenyl)acetyl-CoA isomerase
MIVLINVSAYNIFIKGEISVTIITSYETISVELDQKTAWVSFNRPKSLNALNVQMMKELVHCFKDLTLNSEVNIVVLKGNGRGFSSGGDIKEMLAEGDESQFFTVMDCINELVMALYNMPKITIAGIHGAVAGLGLSIALATDFVVAEEDSKLAMNFIGIGLIPDGGGHFLLERRVGESKAKQIIWDGKVMNAQEALAKGIIDKAISSGALEEALKAKVEYFSSKPILSMIKSKKILSELNRPKLLKSLELEKHGQLNMRKTADHKEGVQAFIEKRQALFKGE